MWAYYDLSHFVDHKAEGMDQSWDKGSWVYCWSYVSYVIDGFDCRWPSWCEQGKVSYCQINEDLLSIFFRTVLIITMTLNLLICSVKTEIVFATIALIPSFSVSRKVNEHAPLLGFWENKHALLKVICYGKYLTGSWIYLYSPLKPYCTKSRGRSTFPRPNKFYLPFSSFDIVGTLVPYMAWHVITLKDNCYYLLMCIPSQLTNFCLLFNSNRCIKMAIVHDIAEGIYLNLLYFMFFFIPNVENCHLPRLISLRWRWID